MTEEHFWFSVTLLFIVLLIIALLLVWFWWPAHGGASPTPGPTPDGSTPGATPDGPTPGTTPDDPIPGTTPDPVVISSAEVRTFQRKAKDNFDAYPEFVGATTHPSATAVWFVDSVSGITGTGAWSPSAPGFPVDPTNFDSSYTKFVVFLSDPTVVVGYNSGGTGQAIMYGVGGAMDQIYGPDINYRQIFAADQPIIVSGSTLPDASGEEAFADLSFSPVSEATFGRTGDTSIAPPVSDGAANERTYAVSHPFSLSSTDVLTLLVVDINRNPIA